MCFLLTRACVYLTAAFISHLSPPLSITVKPLCRAEEQGAGAHHRRFINKKPRGPGHGRATNRREMTVRPLAGHSYPLTLPAVMKTDIRVDKETPACNEVRSYLTEEGGGGAPDILRAALS